MPVLLALKHARITADGGIGMELKRARKETYGQIHNLYMEAFPPAEQAPFWVLIRRAEQKRTDLWNLYEGDAWFGMAYVLHLGDLAYIYYLAIDGAQRSKGYGTRALDALKRQYKGCHIFLSLETADDTADNFRQREERHAFYARAGFEDMPNKVREGRMVFSMMGTGSSVRAKEYRQLVDHAFGSAYRRKMELGFVD